MKIHTRHHSIRGFSLLELLFALAVLSTIAALAIFNMSSSLENSKVTKSWSQAKSICQLYQSARCMGAKFTSKTKEGILEELITGKRGSGPFVTSVFQLELGGEEKAAALAYCLFDHEADTLFFRPASTSS